MSEIKERLEKVRNEIDKHCRKCGREPSEMKLIAVSKTFPNEDIIEAFQNGQRAFGENRAQEIRDKMDDLDDYAIEWHFIGPLQKNKVKYVAGKTKMIHSVEALKIAEEINKRTSRLDRQQNILLEVNCSGEENKHGISPEKTAKLINEIEPLKHVNVCGLMTMAPLTENEDVIRKTFSTLRKLRDRLRKEYKGLTELSMGMTNDYKIAIEEGATLLRIGSAIFGGR